MPDQPTDLHDFLPERRGHVGTVPAEGDGSDDVVLIPPASIDRDSDHEG